MERGDIYFVNLGSKQGSEQGGTRPVVILQNNKGNNNSPTVIIAPITSKQKTILPTHVTVKTIKGLRKRSTVLLEQIQTVNKDRLFEYVGHFPDEIMKKIDCALCTSLSLNKKIEEVHPAAGDECFTEREMEELNGHISRKVLKILHGVNSEPYKNREIRRSVISDIRNQLAREFGFLSSFHEINRKYIADVHEFVDAYELPIFLSDKVEAIVKQAI